MEKMEMTAKEFQSFVARAFNEGVKVGRYEMAKEHFKEDTGYDFDAYIAAKKLVESWIN